MATLNLDNLSFDANKMTAQDIMDFQEKTGGMDLMQFADLMQKGKITEENFLQHFQPIMALIWITARQGQPDVAFEDVTNHPLMPLIESLEVVNRQPGELPQPMARPARKSRAKAATSA